MPERLPHALVAVADLGLFGEETAKLVEAAAQGGVRWVLLRAKGVPRGELENCTRAVMANSPGLFISIHGDAGLRATLSLPGLHFPSGRAKSFRAGVDEKVLLGVSCHSPEEVSGALEDGADYGFLSPLFPPCSKEGFLPPLGLEGFGKIAGGSPLPLLALGGITPDNAGDAIFAGAAGVAVCGALFNSPDVEGTARKLVRSAEQAKKKVFR
jgi:thiamine-phosphate pyrophosphorylase